MGRFPVEPPIRVPPIRLRAQAGAWRVRARRSSRSRAGGHGEPGRWRVGQDGERTSAYRNIRRRLTTGTTWRGTAREGTTAGIVAQERPWRVLARLSAKADRARGILFASSGIELDQSMQTGIERAGRPASSNPPVRLTTGTTWREPESRHERSLKPGITPRSAFSRFLGTIQPAYR